MKLNGPFTYQLTFNETKILSVTNPEGGNTMSGPAAQKTPKLYVISDDGVPVYVGITKQPLRSRLRGGFDENGPNGYHGYAWRRELERATIDVWLQDLGQPDEIETIEAEVVFLIRQQYDQWPKFQTEIHFHRSDAGHRSTARQILDHFKRR